MKLILTDLIIFISYCKLHEYFVSKSASYHTKVITFAACLANGGGKFWVL